LQKQVPGVANIRLTFFGFFFHIYIFLPMKTIPIHNHVLRLKSVLLEWVSFLIFQIPVYDWVVHIQTTSIHQCVDIYKLWYTNKSSAVSLLARQNYFIIMFWFDMARCKIHLCVLFTKGKFKTYILWYMSVLNRSSLSIWRCMSM
jgi:hypothetical protein